MAEITFTDNDFANQPTSNNPSSKTPKADFAASLHGLNYNVDVLRQKLDPSVDLELKPKSEYRKTDAFKDLPEEQFNTWYQGVETAFNAFEQNKDFNLDNPFVKTLFDTPYTRALQATDPRVKIGANIKQEFDLNPFAVTQGMASKDQFHQGNSVDEAAQRSNFIMDSKTGKFKVGDEPIGNLATYLDYLPRGLMIATDINGVPKLDSFGRPYYETIDGRDTTGKEHLMAKADNFLTQEGSFLNAIDPFDSDQIEKNTARSIIKNTLKVGSYFLPYGIGYLVSGTSALLNMGTMFAEGWKTFSALGNKLSGGEYKPDEDVEEKANRIANITKSLTWGSTTEEEQKDPWSIASLSNVLADGVGQIRTQRFLAQAPIFGRALVDPKFRKALEAGDKSAQSYLNASKNLARAYMTGQAAMEVGEAFEQAGLDKGTKDLAMGAAALAFGALYQVAPFDWMLDGVGVNAVQKAAKKVVEKEVKDLASSLAAETAKKALTEVEKKAFLAKGLSTIQNKVKDFMQNTNFAETFKGAANEALEEGTETLMGEGLKLGFQFLGKNNLIKADKDALKKLDPFGEGFLEDLALSAVAGGMSGGVFGLAQDIKNRNQAKDINSLADIVQNGYSDYALNELETLRNLGKKGKGLVSDKLSTEIERMENGMPIYKPMVDGTALTSQNDYVINTVKQQLLSTHFALKGIDADKEGLDNIINNANSLYSSVAVDAKNSSLLTDAKELSRELIGVRSQMQDIEDAYQKQISATTGNDPQLKEEMELKLSPLRKKEDQLKQRFDEITKVGKEKSELAEDYLRESLYKANPFAWAGFDIKSKSDFTQDKVGAELEQAEKEWNEYRLFKRNADVKKAYQEAKDIFNNSELFKKVKDPETNLDNLIRNQQVEYLLSSLNKAQQENNQEEADKISAQLDAIFDDDTYTPTQDVLDMLKQKGDFEIPDVQVESIYDESGVGFKTKQTSRTLKLNDFDSENYKQQLAEQLKDDQTLKIDTNLGFANFGERELEKMEQSPEFGEYAQSLVTSFENDPKEYPLGALEVMWDDPENGEGYREELEPLIMAKLNRIYDIVESLRDNPLVQVDKKLSAKNKKLAENLAKKIKLADIERVIKDNYETFERDPKNYRDANPKADSSITKQLTDRLKQVKKLKSTLQMPYQINPIVNKAKKSDPDKFANPEAEFEFTDGRQAFYLDNYLSNLQAQLEDLLDKLKQNQEGDIKIVRAGFLKGASKLVNNIIAANQLSDESLGFTADLRTYTSLEDDDILKKSSLDEDARRLYEVLAKVSDTLKDEKYQKRSQDTKKQRTEVDVPDLKDYKESYVFFEEALRRGDYREFLDRLHGIKEAINSEGSPVRIPTFEQEFAIFQAYSMVQAARDGRLKDTSPEGTKSLDFFNSIFIDGRPGIGKSDIIMRYLVELIKQDSGVEINITAKNNTVVDEVLVPKFGADNVKRLADLEFDASKSVDLEPMMSYERQYYHPRLPHAKKEGLTNSEPVARLKQVYLIDEATHLNTALVKQMSEKDNAVFIFLGDTTQDGASESMDVEGEKVIDNFFQYTTGMERVPRITLSLRQSSENYDGNAAKLERLTKLLYQSPVGKLKDTYEEYTKDEKNSLNFVYVEDSKGALVEGVKISDNPLEEAANLRVRLVSEPDARVAVISDNGENNAKYPPNFKVLQSNAIQGQEFDYVIIDNIAFDEDPLIATRKLNTLLSRYKQAMVLPGDIVNQYPMTTTKKEGAVSKLVVLTPEVLEELKQFSLSLTKNFGKTKVTTQSSVSTKPPLTKDGYAEFEENDEDKPEISSGQESKPAGPAKVYLYPSVPGQSFDITIGSTKLSGLTDKQKLINDIRDLSEDEFAKKYPGVEFELIVDAAGKYYVTVKSGNQQAILLSLPETKYLSNRPQVGSVNRGKLKSLLNRSSIFNRKNGAPVQKPLGEVTKELDSRGIKSTFPMVINIAPTSLQNEIDTIANDPRYAGVSNMKKVKERVMKDMLGWQGKAVSLQSSDPDVVKNIDELNKNYDNVGSVDFFDVRSIRLIQYYIEHSLDYHAGIPERFNISVGFVKRGNQRTLGEYVEDIKKQSKAESQGLPRMSKSELRRFGTLVYNYMRSVVETNENPMSDPLFQQLAEWKHGPGLYVVQTDKGFELDDTRQSATGLLFGFVYENGKFLELIPEPKLKADGTPETKKVKKKGKEVEVVVLENKPKELKNKSDLPQKLKPYTRKVLNPYLETTEFEYDYQNPNTDESEVKQYSLLEALAGVDTTNNMVLSNNMFQRLQEAKAQFDKTNPQPSKPEDKSPLERLLDFAFVYRMEEAIPYYKVANSNTDYALRTRKADTDKINHNQGGRFPVLEVPADGFNELFGVTPRVSASEIVKTGPGEEKKQEPQQPSGSTQQTIGQSANDIVKKRTKSLIDQLNKLEQELKSFNLNNPVEKIGALSIISDIDSIKKELNSKEPIEVVSELKDLIIPTTIHGKDQTIFTTHAVDRVITFVQIDGKRYGFYQSGSGTDGKTKNHWYPFYGKAAGWVVKDGWEDQNNTIWKYNSQASPELQAKLEEAANKLNQYYGQAAVKGVPYIHDESENEFNTLVGSQIKDANVALRYDAEEYKKVKRETAEKGFTPPNQNVNPPSNKPEQGSDVYFNLDGEFQTPEPPDFGDVPLPSEIPYSDQSGDQQAPIDSFKPGDLTPKAPVDDSIRWSLSPEMYNSILAVGYRKPDSKGRIKPNLSAFDKVQLADLIYGTNGMTLQRLGIDFLVDEVLTPIYYYNYKTGDVLPDVYSKEGVKNFNQHINKLLEASRAAVQQLTGVEDTSSEAFYLKLQELMLNIENDLDKQKIVAEYLTLQNLEHIVNFNLYSDVSDILSAELTQNESGEVQRVFVPQNRIPDVTFDKESSDRGGTESSSAFTKNMLQRLPRLILQKDPATNKLTPALHPARRSGYKEMSKWLSEVIYNSDGELVDAQGNVDVAKLREEYENVLKGEPVNYDKEGIVNLYLLLFNDQVDSTGKPVPFTSGPTTIFSLNQALRSAQAEAIATGNIEKAQIMQNVKTSTNLFSKLKWLSVTAVDEVNLVDQNSKTKMSSISEKYPTFDNKEKRKSGLEKLLSELYSPQQVEKILSSKNATISKYKTNTTEFINMKPQQISNLIQEIEKLLENEKFKPISSSTTNVNGDSINTTGTKNISRDVENLVKKTEANYENFKDRTCN